jgi:hypothetical protein
LEKLTDIKHPKGYPLEHMIGNCCPDGIESVAEGVVKTLENIVSTYKSHRLQKTAPTLPDRGVPTHNVWKRISNEDFEKFYDHIENYAKIARQAFDATSGKDQVKYWRQLFGNKFPYAPDDDNDKDRSGTGSSGGFTERSAPSIIGGGRFA